MKKSWLVSSLLLVVVLSYGQSFKGVFSFGLTGSQIDGDRQAGYYYVGGFATTGVELEVADNVGLLLQGGVASKGMRNPELNTRLSLAYLELPLQLYYNLDNITIGGGVYAAYLMRAKFSSGSLKQDRLDLMRRRDVGLTGRIAYRFKEENEVFLRADYSASTIKAGFVRWYNNTLRLGVKIALN